MSEAFVNAKYDAHLNAIEDRVADVYDHAMRYVAKRVATEGCMSSELGWRSIEVDAAWHDLRVVAGYGCDCDEGTCPSEVSDV